MANVTNSEQETVVPQLLLNCVGVAGNLFLLFIIRKTKTLRGFSGLLLSSEQIACIVQNILNVAYFVLLFREKGFGVGFFVATQTLFMVSLLLLFAINVNLYLAVCKNQQYKSLVTRKSISIVIILSWIFSAGLSIIPIIDKDYFSVKKDSESDIQPQLKPVPLSHVAVVTAIGVVIVVLDVVFMVKIYRGKQIPSALNAMRYASETMKKLNLARFVFIISITYTLTFCVWNFNKYIAEKVDLGAFRSVFTVINRLIIIVRPAYYLLLYRPLWNTLKSLFVRQNGNTVNPDRRKRNSTSTSNTQQASEISTLAVVLDNEMS